MEGGLTFTIGKGFGQMLQRIAWETLTEKYNPREAVEIITKSLPGCTEGMAVDILDGKIILGEDEATQEVLGTPRAGGKFNDWIREQRIHLEEEAKEWVKSLEGIRQEIVEAGGTPERYHRPHHLPAGWPRLRPLRHQVSGPDHGYHQSIRLGGINQNHRIT